MIKIEGLRKRFDKNEVLKGIDLDLSKEGITAILGPNGSGKTTLIKCILGMVLPNSGKILFDDEDIKNQFLYRGNISHLPQIAHFPENLTGDELISMISDLRPGAKRKDELIEIFELREELGKKMNDLSGGNRQKVNILLALMYECSTLILDEPSTGLDPLALLRLKDFLKKERDRKSQILITTHIMSFVEEIADYIVFLLDGKVYFHGTLESILKMQSASKLEDAIAGILQETKA